MSNLARTYPWLSALLVLGSVTLGGCEAPSTGLGGLRHHADEDDKEERTTEPAPATVSATTDSSFDPNDRTMDLEVDGAITTVHYVDRSGTPVAFGDIALPTTSAAHTTVATSVTQVQRWPGGVIPYVVTLPEHEAAFAAGIALWTAKTSSVRFVRRTTETDYVEVFKGDGCFSQIGRVGGRQTLSLGDGCAFGEVVAHELGHAMGLWHEQSRADRDSFVTIHLENVLPDQRHNFDKVSFTSIGAFDLASIMLYDSTAFSSNGQSTIVRRDGSTIARNEDVSAGDVAGIEALYQGTTTPNPTTTTTTTTENDLAVTLANLHLRSGPSTAYGILTTIPEGETVELTGFETDGWLSVRYEGIDGWAYSAYLW